MACLVWWRHSFRARSATKLMMEASEVVISGLSGRLPESESMEEFAQHLFNGIDMVTSDDRRWEPGLFGLPERNGKLKELGRFDAQYFGVHGKQAHLMDPQLRLLLEVTHEALVDAGLSPVELRGSRTGVYVGVSNSEAEELWSADPESNNGFALTGCCRAMFANRISYTFNLHGPSHAVDTACSSSMVALVQAFRDIRAGVCDAAVVAGSNLCLKPTTSLNFQRLGMLSSEGRCASFDAAGRGYVRSEAVVALLLQRRGAARRVYATVCGARVNTDGHKAKGITFPSSDMQRRLAAETFAEARLRPQDVSYVEAHGTGTRVGDPQEVNAIAELFCAGRSADCPLLLGSVKSNMGHSEAASGLCSVAKVLLAMERGIIPANLHFSKPNPKITALNDGRIKVVTENMLWDGGLVAINSFGFGGANAHVILKSASGGRPPPTQYSVPRLVVASGRSVEGVRELLALAAEDATDAELHALLDAVHAHNIPGHTHRGYALLADATTVGEPTQEVHELESGEPRPVWFVFSGMGTQWAGVARTLMALPAFAASVRRSAAVLEPHGVDVVYIVTEAPDDAFDDVIACFVLIAAVQMALVDVLRELNVHPDGIIGTSMGEIGCAYADGVLTSEQAILAAYWRGRSIADAALAPGAMLTVGMSREACAARLPPGVSVAIHNAADNVTVAGPVGAVHELEAQLAAEGVFVHRVRSSGVAFHSTHVAAAAPLLRRSLQQVILHPKPRSPRWISTSVPEVQWGSDIARTCDAEYYVNNLVSPVWLAEALRHVPARALLVEVSPHGHMQSLLARAVQAPGTRYVALLRRAAACPLAQLLRAVGRLHAAGAQPRVHALYPPVAWPVSRATPALAPRLRWDHAAEWAVARYSALTDYHKVEVDLSCAEDAFLAGHDIDGRVLFPASGYLTMVWRILAKLQKQRAENTAVVLEDVHFRRATFLARDVPVTFLVRVLDGGAFEVRESSALVVEGRARLAPQPARERLVLPPRAAPHDPALLPLTADDVYKEMHLRGYYYSGTFRGIRASDACITSGDLLWDGNWITYMDSMIQFCVVGLDTGELYLPTRLRRAFIDPTAQPSPGAPVPVLIHRDVDVISAGGVELRGIKFSLVSRQANAQAPSKLEQYSFVPYEAPAPYETDLASAHRDALIASLQILLENAGTLHLKMCEVVFEHAPEALLLPAALAALDREPQVDVDASLAAGAAAGEYQAMQELGIKVSNVDARFSAPDAHCHAVLATDVLTGHGAFVLSHLVAALAPGGMLVLKEPAGASEEPATRAMLARTGLHLVSRQLTASIEILLIRAPPVLPTATPIIIDVTDDINLSWVEELREAMARSESEMRRVYVWSRAADSGVLGLAACLRAEPGGRTLRAYYLPGAHTAFAPDAPEYAARVALDLTVNVLRDGVWGSYRHKQLDADGCERIRTGHAYVNTLVRGDLTSLRWIQSELALAYACPQPPGTELCRVYYASLNFRDVMLATGKLSPDALPGSLAAQECVLGLEFSGRSASGTRVMGMVATRGLATSVLANRNFLWEVPPAWTLEEAATVPVAYATAYYALTVRGRMRRGESVLVHAGAGGVGQAAIAIALAAGCSVFATAGTTAKRAFLRARFPAIPETHLGDSRDASFEQLVLTETAGRGVDLVLNSLAGELLHASIRCLAAGGRFLEIGKLDLSQDSTLGMAIFLRNVTFHGILLDALFDADHPEKAEVVQCVTEGIAKDVVRPLPSTVFSDRQLEAAFRYMANGKHMGKVMVRVCEGETGDVSVATPCNVLAVPRTYMHPDKSYVLVGGLGGIGLELAGWLVQRGATRLLLAGRSGVRTGYQAWCVRRWRAAGVHVCVRALDAAAPGAARSLLAEAARMGPVGGVFHLAAVLRINLLRNQTREDFYTVTRPKIDASRALDEATRELAPELDHFVVWSSVASGRGMPGQANYGLANSSMERLVERRRAHGLPGLAVQWGAVADVGMVVDASGYNVIVSGTEPQRIASCLAALDELMTRPHAVAASTVLPDKHRVATAPSAGLLGAVAKILGIADPAKTLDSTNLADLGLDSLTSVEIEQTLARFDAALTTQEIRALTFGELRALAARKHPILV